MSKSALVLGGGLAGSFMACRLAQRGWTVTVIDDRHPASASRVAAGLYNVITGRFGAKTWMAETFLAEIKAVMEDPFYAGMDKFVHPLEIYRPFRDVEEYNLWSGRSVDPAYRDLVAFEERPVLSDVLNNPLGGIRILPCGWVDIAGLIDFLQEKLVQRGVRILQSEIPYGEINPSDLSWSSVESYLQFDAIVCCEGHRIRQNPWFGTLPVQPNKGEILEIEAPDLVGLPFVISRKVYIVPGRSGNWIVGSTYKNHFEDPDPTEEGKAEIIEHLDKVLKVPYTVIGHRAGIRPTSPNRRPIMGEHPRQPGFYVLTGFGTKGMLAAPWSSRLLAATIDGEESEYPEDVRLARFKAWR